MVYRTFACDDCNSVWEVEQAMDDPHPDCPTCSKVLEWRPQSFNIGGSTVSKGVDYAQKIMEEDYGLTNFKDNVKPGEVGAVMPTTTTVEQEKITREVVQYVEQTKTNKVQNDFWGASHGSPSHIGSVTGQTMLGMAKTGPQGPDPMKLLHDGVKSGRIPRPKTNIVAAADMEGKAVKRR